MSDKFPRGVWPTMVTPFREDRKIDETGLAALVEWYIARRVDGLFAVCQSSEMFELDLEERIRLAKATVAAARGRVPVIASGHISDDPGEQAREMQAIAATGVVAVILVNNRLAAQNESDDIFKARCEKLFAALPRDVSIGFYECPHPYKRLFTPELLRWCADTGRVRMLKDTCCDAEQIAARQRAIEGTPLAIYNANAATLLETLRSGIAGYSGVMANFHPQLYVWLCRSFGTRPAEAERLQAWLGTASAIEGPAYPRNAKYYLRLEGLPITTVTRRACRELGPADRRLIEQFRTVSRDFEASYPLL
jgi:4-hydroxy-tetrahydrodipicolinate synthase